MLRRPLLLAAFSFLFLPCVFAQKAGSTFDVFGLYTWAVPKAQIPLDGWGGGGTLLFYVGPHPQDNVRTKWRMQVGAGGYGSFFGSREVVQVPLQSPQTGFASVMLNNTHAGGHALVRFSRVGSARTMYYDAFCGFRYADSHISIRPYDPMPGYETQTNMTYDWLMGFNTGVGAGMIQKLTPYIYFDAELMWSYTPENGRMINVSSAHAGVDGLTFEPLKAPNQLMLLKAGIRFFIPEMQGAIGSSFDSTDNSSDTSTPTYDSGSSGSDSGGSAPNSIQINTGSPK